MKKMSVFVDVLNLNSVPSSGKKRTQRRTTSTLGNPCRNQSCSNTNKSLTEQDGKRIGVLECKIHYITQKRCSVVTPDTRIIRIPEK